MAKILNLYKKLGETPLARVNRVKREYADLEERSLTYLGRLDPMAEGVLLVGVDVDEVTRGSVLGLEKEYEFSILCGMATDTHDVLGLVTECVDRLSLVKLDMLKVVEYLARQIGALEQRYPDYSSKPVDGKPLFSYARAGQSVERPTHQVVVHALSLVRIEECSGKEILNEISRRVKMVRGDFRQEAILGCWERTLGPLYDVQFPILTLKAKVSSGTYVRVMADEFGRAFGFPSLAYSIKRLSVGKYRLENSLK